MAGINPYSLNPNQMANAMGNGLTSTQSVMPPSNNPLPAKLTSSFSTLQNLQSIQNQQAASGLNPQGGDVTGGNGTGGIIASQMRSRASTVAPAVQTAVRQEQSGLQLQPQKGLQPGQASANASPKMTVY